MNWRTELSWLEERLYWARWIYHIFHQLKPNCESTVDIP